MNAGSIRRREMLAGGTALLAGLAGCSQASNLTNEQQTRSIPLIEVKITNEDYESYTAYVLLQSTNGDIHTWNEYELQSATKNEGVKIAEAVKVGTGELCLNDFLVSISIDGGEHWTQISGDQYHDNYEDLSSDQGATPEAVITDGKLTFSPQMSTFPTSQCKAEKS